MDKQNYLAIDVTDLLKKSDELREFMSERQFNSMMYAVIRRGAQKARQLVSQEVAHDYTVSYSWVHKQLGMPHYVQSPPGATIKVKGARGPVKKASVNSVFPSRSAGLNTSTGRKRRNPYGRSGSVSMSSVRGQFTTMPAGLDSDRRHFMITRGKKQGFVFVALAKTEGGTLFRPHKVGKWVRDKNGRNRYVIKAYRYEKTNERVVYAVGISVAQMPLNRSEAGIQLKVQNLLMERLEHEFEFRMSQIK